MINRRKQKVCLNNSSSGLGGVSVYNQSEWKVTVPILNK